MPKWLRIFFALVVVIAGTNLPVLLVSASPFHAQQTTYYMGDMSQGITVTINPAYSGPMPPINFVSAVSGKDIQLTWDYQPGTTGVIIVRQADVAPTDITDGVVVFNGAGTMFTDTGSANENVEYFYRAFGTVLSLVSTGYADTSAGGWGMTALGNIVLFGVLIGAAVILTIAAYATKKLQLSLIAALLWGAVGGYSYLQSRIVDAAYTPLYIVFGLMGFILMIGEGLQAFAFREKKDEVDEDTTFEGQLKKDWDERRENNVARTEQSAERKERLRAKAEERAAKRYGI